MPPTESEYRKIKHTTLRELRTREFPTREFIIEPWLRVGDTAVIWAQTGAGKSMLCTSLALAVTGGGAAGPWTASKARKVMLIDGEMNIQDLRDRIALLSEGGGGQYGDEASILDRLEISARQDQPPGRPFYDLTDEAAQIALADRIKRGAFELVILDNFTTLTDGLEDENASTAFKGVQRFLLRMKQQGVATILVHHANKAGTDMRGSSALAATFEVVLYLDVASRHRPGQASFTTDFRKFRGRGSDALSPQTWTLEDGRWVVDGVDDAIDRTKEEVLQAVLSGEFATQAEVAKSLNLDPSTVSRRLRELDEEEVLSEAEKRGYLQAAREQRRGRVVSVEEVMQGFPM